MTRPLPTYRPARVMAEVVKLLAAAGGPLTRAELCDLFPAMKPTIIRDAVDVLVAEGIAAELPADPGTKLAHRRVVLALEPPTAARGPSRLEAMPPHRVGELLEDLDGPELLDTLVVLGAIEPDAPPGTPAPHRQTTPDRRGEP